MKVFLITFIIASVILALCLVGMGIGKLLTGKCKLNCKRCGNPEKKSGCDLCKKNPKDKKH